jgi:hypothetical protein
MTTITKPSPQITASPNPVPQIRLYNTDNIHIIKGIKIIRTLSPKDLVPRLGTSEAMVRIFLRKYYPDTHIKNKSWSISPELARQIEADYKNKVKAREAEKKLRIEKELAGELETED